MSREELLELLYYIKNIFYRAEKLAQSRQSLQNSYQNLIPHEGVRRYIEYKPYIKNEEYKEKKKIKGIKGFLVVLGIWVLLMVYSIYDMLSLRIYCYITLSIAESIVDLLYYFIFMIYGREDIYLYPESVQLYITMILNFLIAIVIKKIINSKRIDRNKQAEINKQKVLAQNNQIRQENLEMSNVNKKIEEHNRNLGQINKEIDRKNEQINIHNQNVKMKIAEVDNNIIALREETERFMSRGIFPYKDFQPAIIEFYIDQVENHRCETIKECANAYDMYVRDQENKRAMAETINNQQEQLRLQQEQLQWQQEQVRLQNIGNILQLENLAALIYNTATVNRMNNNINRSMNAMNNNMNSMSKNVSEAARAANEAAYQAEKMNRRY